MLVDFITNSRKQYSFINVDGISVEDISDDSNLKFYYAQPLVVDDQAVAGAAYSIRLYFSDGALLLYVYIILFLIALLVKRYGRSVFGKYVGRKD